MVGTKKVVLLISMVFMVLAAAMLSRAAQEPTAPSTLNVLQTQTYSQSNYPAQSVEALAGNLTQLYIHAVVQTRAWQGYWGNITGTITLDDENNYTFYNWSAAEPRGEVYSTLSSNVDWLHVGCFDFTNSSGADWDTIESYYNIDYDDADGINETYVYTDHDPFQVAWRTMTGCPTTYIFRDDQPQTADFQNILLMDLNNPTNGWIYTTLIENRSNATGAPPDLTCFNGEYCDFQILVNEDGHGTDTATTTYYFWVELD